MSGAPNYRNLSPAQKRREIAKIEAGLRTMWNEPDEPRGNGLPMKNGRSLMVIERNTHEALQRLNLRTGYDVAVDDVSLESIFEPMSAGDLEEWGIRNDTVQRMFRYLTAAGPEAWNILSRIFAIGSHMMIEPFCLLNLREKALMLGESHGAQHWRMKRLCTDPLLRKGAKSIKAPGMKGLKAQASAAQAQQGNSNRAFKKPAQQANGNGQHVPARRRRNRA